MAYLMCFLGFRYMTATDEKSLTHPLSQPPVDKISNTVHAYVLLFGPINGVLS